MMKRHSHTLAPALAAALVALLAAPALADDQESYGYFRTVEGRASLTTLDEGDPIDVEINYPVLPGDRLWVTEGSRVEMLLPDRSVLRADGGTDLFLESLALSTGNEEGTPTVIRLLTGEIQFVYTDTATYLEPPRIDTGSTAVYLQAPGNYRIVADEDRWTEVVVRDGFAELTTDRGSSVLRDGEELFVEYGYPPGSVRAAGSFDSLERWGADLEGYEVADETYEYVDESLHYAARPLRDHGSWVWVGGSYAWRPYARAGWRPYTAGRWVYTPAGLTWVSFEPFGWVTSHYGTWDWADSYGWVWHPGRAYSPAWVYWYWGPTHVAWVPAGYYTGFYGPRWSVGFGFRHGVYGWAGGYWSPWSRWTFCPTRYFGRRNYRAYWRSGDELSRHGSLRAVPRGLVTNDTRPLRPEHWGKPSEALRALKDDAAKHAALRGGSRHELPDVTRFIARDANLADDARKAVLREGAFEGRGRSAEAARKPGTSSPWRAEKPLPGAATRSPRTLASERVTIDRRKAPSGIGEPGSRAFDRGSSGSRGLIDEKPGARVAVPDRDSAASSGSRIVLPPTARGGAVDRSKVDSGGSRPALPPSARGTGGSRLGDVGKEPVARDVPPVRRILDGVRSYSTRSPKESSGGTPQSQTPTTRKPSPPSSGSSSSGSSTRSAPSRKPSSGSSARKPSSRSSGSKGSSGRASSRKPSKPKPKPKPRP